MALATGPCVLAQPGPPPTYEFIKGMWTEANSAASQIALKYTYHSKPLPAIDAYFKAYNAFDKVAGGSGMLRDEGYSKKFPGFEHSYECILYGLKPDRFSYSINDLNQGTGPVLHLSNGKLNWIVDSASKIATLAKDATPPWPPRYDVFAFGLPLGVGPREAKVVKEYSLPEVIENAIPELSQIVVTGPDTVSARLVEKKENPVMETFHVRDVELLSSKGFALKSYTYRIGVKHEGEFKTLNPVLKVEYSKHQQLSSGIWVPGEITIREYGNLPKEISKASIEKLPWLPATTENYEIRKHKFSLSDAIVEERLDKARFGLKIEDLGKGFRIVDEVSGNVYVVGDPLEDLGNEVEPQKDGRNP